MTRWRARTRARLPPEEEPRRRSLLSNATVLINRGVDVEGLHIWASPVTPGYAAAFGMSSPEQRARHWSTVPAADVLVTHGPPFGILDRSPGGEQIGDRELLAAVQRTRPVLHVFGHVHGAYGQFDRGATLFVNCALPDEEGKMVNVPVVFKVPRRA